MCKIKAQMRAGEQHSMRAACCAMKMTLLRKLQDIILSLRVRFWA